MTVFLASSVIEATCQAIAIPTFGGHHFVTTLCLESRSKAFKSTTARLVSGYSSNSVREREHRHHRHHSKNRHHLKYPKEDLKINGHHSSTPKKISTQVLRVRVSESPRRGAHVCWLGAPPASLTSEQLGSVRSRDRRASNSDMQPNSGATSCNPSSFHP